MAATTIETASVHSHCSMDGPVSVGHNLELNIHANHQTCKSTKEEDERVIDKGVHMSLESIANNLQRSAIDAGNTSAQNSYNVLIAEEAAINGILADPDPDSDMEDMVGKTATQQRRVCRLVVESEDDDDNDATNRGDIDLEISDNTRHENGDKNDGVNRANPSSSSESEGGVNESIPKSKKFRKFRVYESTSGDSDAETNASHAAKSSKTKKAATKKNKDEELEKKRMEHMKKLMALGDAESSDEEQLVSSKRNAASAASVLDKAPSDEDTTGRTATDRASPKKKHARKTAKEAADGMRQIRSAAQKRVRESRLNLPYARPRQHTLHEFLARRKKSAVLPEDIRMKDVDTETISRRLEESERELDRFYAPAPDDDGEQDDPEWTPSASDPMSAKPVADVSAMSTAEATVTPVITGAADKAVKTLGNDAVKATEEAVAEHAEEEDSGVMSQSSQKVQEWLEGVSAEVEPLPVAECTASSEAALENSSVPGRGTFGSVGNGMDKSEGVLLKDGVDCSPIVGGKSPAMCAARQTSTGSLQGVETASLSAETETSLTAGDTASTLNMRTCVAPDTATRHSNSAPGAVPRDPTPVVSAPNPVVTTSAAAATVTGSTRATTAATSRRAALAVLLPPGVLNATPRLERTTVGDTISLDSDGEGAQEPDDLDKFVERFVRHSKATKVRKSAENKTITLSTVRMESDAAGEQRLVADSVAVTLTSTGTAAAEGAPGAQRQLLQRTLMTTIRAQREQARQRREREHRLYNSEQVDDAYLDDLPDEEAELSDVSSSAGESEPEPEPPLVETKRKRNPLVDDEADVEDDEDEDVGRGAVAEGEEPDEEEEELKLELEGDDEEGSVSGAPARRDSVYTEPEMFSSQPNQPHHSGEVASEHSHDSDNTSSLVTAHQPGGGFQRFAADSRPINDEDGHDATPTPATPTLATQPCSRIALPVEDTQDMNGTHDTSIDDLSQLGPLRLTPQTQTHAQSGPRSAIGALLDPAADETFDDLMSLCSGKFDAQPSKKAAKVARANTQPAADLLSLPAPTTKDGVVSWAAERPSPAGAARAAAAAADRRGVPSAVDLFEDGNANMPPLQLSVVESDDEDAAQDVFTPSRVRKRQHRRRLVFSDDEEESADWGAENADSSEDEWNKEQDGVPNARNDDMPTDFAGFLNSEKRKSMVRSEFFEGEAELSGSDEPSEDEADGEDLDQMDEEEADREHMDEHKLRQQVERIHQKRALDDDIREMKLFQERFLEDGDLEGKGRERKFRWNNNDVEGDELERRASDEEVEDTGAAAADESWRRERHERESWLLENAGKTDGAAETEEVSAFSFLRPDRPRPVRRLLSTGGRRPVAPPAPGAGGDAAPPSAPPTVASATAQSMPPSPLRQQKVSRGSFLHRGREALARLVSTARSLSMPAGSSSKSSTNRTFAVGKRPADSAPDADVEQEFSAVVEEKTTKRKAIRSAKDGAGDSKRPKISRSFSAVAEDSQSSLFSVIL